MTSHPMTLCGYSIITAFLTHALSCAAEPYAGWAAGGAKDGYGTIIATADSGATWVRQGSGQIANVQVGGVFAVTPLAAWAVGAPDAGYATIYHTVDGGITWTRKGVGQAALLNIELLKVHVSSNIVWAVGKDAILRSDDAGATWTNCLPVAYTNTLLQAVFSLGGSTVWAGGEGTTITDHATLLYSTNAGQSWVQQVVTQADHILGVSAVNPQTAWAVGGDGFVVLRTDDGGTTWLQQPAQGGLGDANEVDAVNTQVVWVAVDNFIEWTTNGGQDWTTHGVYNYVMGISAVNETEVWAVSTGGITMTGDIWHTSTGGVTWEPQTLAGEAPAPLWNVSFAHEPVPEPGSAAIIVAMGAAVMRIRRRRAARTSA